MAGRPFSPARTAGFTLIELLFTLAITAVLLSAGWPSWQEFVARQSLRAAVGEIHSGLNHGRLLAITSGLPVIVCPTTNQQSCSTDPEWHRGWLTFQDLNRNRERDDGEPLLQVTMPRQTGIRATSSRYRRKVRFLPNGFSPGTNLTIAFCLPGESAARETLVVSNNGRPRRGDPDGRGCT